MSARSGWLQMEHLRRWMWSGGMGEASGPGSSEAADGAFVSASETALAAEPGVTSFVRGLRGGSCDGARCALGVGASGAAVCVGGSAEGGGTGIDGRNPAEPCAMVAGPVAGAGREMEFGSGTAGPMGAEPAGVGIGDLVSGWGKSRPTIQDGLEKGFLYLMVVP
ncbi:MAG TPA: hypothetical protein VLW83_16190 [Candidatus Acidoferrales bacterium]|nr:hypothetical protein [Candidatus Acidoferrales bacterium]